MVILIQSLQEFLEKYSQDCQQLVHNLRTTYRNLRVHGSFVYPQS